MDKLITLVTILVVISGAAERIVEVIKNYVPRLSHASLDPVLEARRQGTLHLIAIVACLITAGLSYQPISDALSWNGDKWVVITCLGVLAAGGASLWNSVLTYLLSVKDIKRAEVAQQKKSAVQVATQRSREIPDVPPKSLESYTS